MKPFLNINSNHGITSSRILLALVLILLSCLRVDAQTSFKLIKEKGHYFMDVPINGQSKQRIFVESGIPGLLINKSTFNSLFKDIPFQNVENGISKIISHNLAHNVDSILNGSITIGDFKYSGNIFIIDNYEYIGIPIHRLTNSVDSLKNLIKIDFKNRTFEMIGYDDIKLSKWRSLKINMIDQMPTFYSDLFIVDRWGNSGSVVGNFVFDLGNGSPIFLFSRNIRFKEFITKSKIKLSDAKDQNGRVFGKGIYASFCQLDKCKNGNISVGISDVINIKNCIGCVGPSFFNKGVVIIDSKESKILYR